eukprot:1388448-Rhodomonas_salina.1
MAYWRRRRGGAKTPACLSKYGGRKSGAALQAEIKHKKPQFQYNLYQECGFSYWMSGCKLAVTAAR